MGLKINCPICLENIQSLTPNETVPIYPNLHPKKYSHTLQHLVLHAFKDWPEHTCLCHVYFCIYSYIYIFLYLIRETTPPVYDKHYTCSRYKIRRATRAAWCKLKNPMISRWNHPILYFETLPENIMEQIYPKFSSPSQSKNFSRQFRKCFTVLSFPCLLPLTTLGSVQA